MEYFIGVDGGGTKTAFALAAKDSVTRAVVTRTGCSYQALGVCGAVEVVREGIAALLASAGVAVEDCAGCCIGMPYYGENAAMDRQVREALQAALAPVPVHVVNDVEVGWAGSLACRDGIHLVAGTGSIAFGCGQDGRTARCGGWNEFFGDEGSCYWVGRQAMSLFSKEADGRVPRGPLYGIVRQELGLTEDFEFAEQVLRGWAGRREQVAAFQKLACQAAEEGDSAAAALFENAAQELALMVKALQQALAFSPGATAVSYSGGLFKAGELVLAPLRKEIARLGGTLQKPRRSATEGAVLLAIKQFGQ